MGGKYKKVRQLLFSMKSQLSSFEIPYLLSEMQFLIGAKVEKIFQQAKPKDDFLFVLHVPGVGKKLLYISLPGILSLSSFKPPFPSTPPFFAASLRRKLSNARIQSIRQKNFERLIIIEFSTAKGNSFLIIELFNPGNMILCDSSWKILAVLHPKKWSDRSVLPNKPYVFPPAQSDPRTLSPEEFKKLILSSDKDSLVKALAIDGNIGGVYSEEIIFRAGLEKNSVPSKLSSEEISSLFKAWTELLAEPLAPHKSSSEIFPIKMHSLKTETISSFNEGIQDMVLNNLERQEISEFSKEAKKESSKFEKIIKSQESQLNGLERQEKENQKKGELIYTHYTALNILLSKIKSLRDEGLSWKEIFELIKKEVPQVKRIDPSTAILEIDLEDKQ